MIVTLKKTNSVKGLISYHEKKVQSQKGELLLDTTLSNSKNDRIKAFEDHCMLNRQVKKGKFTHISISFPREDKVDQDQQLKIAEDYLERMGYGEAPILIYNHSDTSHRHFHIVTSPISWSGKKINVFRDHYKSQEISRRIEVEYGLTVTRYFRSEQNMLQELKAWKLQLSNGIEKLLTTPLGVQALMHFFSESEIHAITSQQLPDDQIVKILQLRGDSESEIQKLYSTLDHHGVLYKTKKQVLVEMLSDIKNKSTSKKDYIQNCRDHGLYVRELISETKSTYFIYGILEKKFYISDRKLPREFRASAVFNRAFQNPNSYDYASQKRFLKRMIGRAVRSSKSFKDFQHRLAEFNILYKTISNTEGIYGVMFKSNDIRHAEYIKGSDIGFSWSKIKASFELEPIEAEKKVQQRPSQFSAPLSTRLSKKLDTSGDDEDERQKRRRSGRDI
jgi:transcriptional regulator of met regulon